MNLHGIYTNSTNTLANKRVDNQKLLLWHLICFISTKKNHVVIKIILSYLLKGSTETVQVLLTLLYKAAECGAQLFIKMILNSSAGGVLFHEYKDSVPLPEVIARNHGHENTALYLEEINARLVTHTAVYCCHATLLPFFAFVVKQII